MKYTFLIVLLIFGCNQSPMSQGSYGEDLLAYAPKSSDMVFYMNAQEIRNSEIAKSEIEEQSQKMFNEGKKHYDEFVTLTGLDPEKDISSFLVALDSKQDNGNKGLVVAKGKFDEAKIIAYIKTKLEETNKRDNKEITMKDEMVNNQKIYHLNGESDNEDLKEVGFTFKDDVIMVSDFSRLKEVISSNSSALENTDLMAKIKTVNGYHMYGVLDAQQLKSQISGNQQAEKIASFIDNVAFAMNFDKDMTMSMVSNCLKETQAQDLKDIIKGLVATARVAVSQERDLIDLMQEVVIDQSNKQVKVSLKIDKDRLKKLKAYEGKLKKSI